MHFHIQYNQVFGWTCRSLLYRMYQYHNHHTNHEDRKTKSDERQQIRENNINPKKHQQYLHKSLISLCTLFIKWEEIVTSPVFLTRVQYTHWQHLAISERNRIKQVSKTGALRASRLCSYAHWSFIQCEGFCFFWSIPSQFILISQVNL